MSPFFRILGHFFVYLFFKFSNNMGYWHFTQTESERKNKKKCKHCPKTRQQNYQNLPEFCGKMKMSVSRTWLKIAKKQSIWSKKNMRKPGWTTKNAPKSKKILYIMISPKMPQNCFVHVFAHINSAIFWEGKKQRTFEFGKYAGQFAFQCISKKHGLCINVLIKVYLIARGAKGISIRWQQMVTRLINKCSSIKKKCNENVVARRSEQRQLGKKP